MHPKQAFGMRLRSATACQTCTSPQELDCLLGSVVLLVALRSSFVRFACVSSVAVASLLVLVVVVLCFPFVFVYAFRSYNRIASSGVLYHYLCVCVFACVRV